MTTLLRPAGTARANRLTFDDALFLTMRRALGVPVVTQTVWRFDTEVAVEDVERFHRRLGHGPLNRVVVRSSVPGARDRWVRSSVTAPLVVAPEPLEPGDVMDWVERHATLDLDPERGPTWSLAVARTTTGGSVLSFLTSHVVADGSLKLAALAAAAEGRELPRLPVDDLAAIQTPLREDLADAAGQAAAAVRGLVGACRARRDPAPEEADQKGAAPPIPPLVEGDDEPWRPATVVVDCPAVEWEAAAAAGGGTGNSLLAAVCVEVLLASGRVSAGEPVRTVLPVSTRGAGDLRSNATTGVTICVETAEADGVGVVPSLARVRAAAKAEFTALSDGTRRDPLAAIRPLLQLVPDAVVRRAATSWPSPLVLASNLGRLSPALEAPVGVPARAVVNRAIYQRGTRNAARRSRAGLSAWWDRAGDTATLCVTGADPDVFPCADVLRSLVERVYARRGLTPSFW
ncbi:hypothetical protein [Nocardioides sp. KR10-350]|uniref:hypothetical protein n=1 Tax=Nocardioides cheoyonin TaxID=3156615 RepID=UPI0032B3452B